MSTVEEQLADLLELQAAYIDPPVGILEGSLRRSRRRRLRRRVAAGGAITAIVGGTVSLGGLLPDRHVALTPTSIRTGSSPQLRTTFPYVATYLPPGTAKSGAVNSWQQIEQQPYDGPVLAETWTSTASPEDHWLDLRISSGSDEATPPSKSTTVSTVRGHPAVVTDFGSASFLGRPAVDNTTLVWQESAGQWMEVSYDGAHITLSQARAFANGLHRQDDTRISWVTMTSGIAGADLLQWSSSNVILSSHPFTVDKDAYVSVGGCRHATFIPDTGMTNVTLGGHTYLFKRASASKVLAVKRVNSTTDLVFDFGGRVWSDDDLAQVIQGTGWTGPTPAAPVITNTC